jgi:hydrogenase/urease accessory protein HupE
MNSQNPRQAASSRLVGLRTAQGGIVVLLVLFSLLPFQEAAAHDPGLSSLTIQPHPDGLEATLTLAVKDAAQLVALDYDGDGIVTQAEFARSRSQLEAVVGAQLIIAPDGKVVRPEFIRGRLDENSNVEVHLDFHTAIVSMLEIQSKLITSLPNGHRQYLRVEDFTGKTITERLLSATADHATAQIAVPNRSVAVRDKNASSFADFLALGVKHILTGYDHLLFLVGLLVVARGFASSLKIITGFTIAHSFTLALATFGLVQIPSRIVEPLIAASIIYVGVDNLFRGDNPKARQLLTSGFGFIHGFGFASALREMGIGSRMGGIVLPLFSFNVGVELGQIMVAAAALPVIWRLRESPMFIARWVPACSAMVVLLGSFWFVERIWMN